MKARTGEWRLFSILKKEGHGLWNEVGIYV